jgi:hypothetical protein
LEQGGGTIRIVGLATKLFFERQHSFFHIGITRMTDSTQMTRNDGEMSNKKRKQRDSDDSPDTEQLGYSDSQNISLVVRVGRSSLAKIDISQTESPSADC